MKLFVKIVIPLGVIAVVLLLGDRIFGIISSPRVISVSPADEASGVALDSKLAINFDKPVNRREISHSLTPDVLGEWNFENPLIKGHLLKTLVFNPAINFAPGTEYKVEIGNVKGFGLGKPASFVFGFKTENLEKTILPDIDYTPPEEIVPAETSPPVDQKITLLDVPFYWQEHKLSCEAASLRMALAAKGVYISESQIMEKIGYDATPRQGNIWGDPNNAFVGNIDGKIGVTGYGVYWDPVARAASNWKEAQAFTNWNLKGLISELSAGNPVMIWGTLPVETLTDISWQTPEGKFIKAIKEDHVRLAVGFMGSPENPSKIIINDPLSGKIFWDTSYFLKNWSAFNNSAVVVR